MTQIQAVVFDIGNVLIVWQPERYYDRTIGVDRRKVMFAEVDLHEMMNVIDAGADFRQTVLDTAEAYPHWRKEITDWADKWCDLAQPAIDHSVRLLKALRSNDVPVFALSNFGVQNFPLSVAQFPFLGEFDRHYISGEMQTRKPFDNIYQMVEQDCGIATEKLLFTDDRDENIITANNRGWQTHLFQGAQGWAECLVNHGLLSKEDAA